MPPGSTAEFALEVMKKEGYESSLSRNQLLTIQQPGKGPNHLLEIGRRDFVSCTYIFPTRLSDGLARHIVHFVLDENDLVVETYEIYDR
ncbi:MAG: hypothetical protein R3C01_09735 [Planctomycetaceae bacterium]